MNKDLEMHQISLPVNAQHDKQKCKGAATSIKSLSCFSEIQHNKPFNRSSSKHSHTHVQECHIKHVKKKPILFDKSKYGLNDD